MNSYDAIVLGTGGMGSAALYELARRGRRVLGLDRHRPGHSKGSSHGHTRVIRQAYYEHPSYVPLVRRAFERWYDLEQVSGKHLLTECGCLSVGPPGGELVEGVLRSAAEHRLPVEELTPADVRRRFPAFRFGDDLRAVHEYRAGFLFVEECVKAYCEAAVGLGAELRGDEPVKSWAADGNGVEVRTVHGTYRAAKLVVTAGAWATELLADIGVPLTVMRQTMLWFPPTDPQPFRRDRFPVFMADVPGGPFYGLPMSDFRGVKVARHYGAPEVATPNDIDWTVGPRDTEPVLKFLKAHMPGVEGPPSFGQVCLYTLTPDRHFVIDRHPKHPQVVVAAGFSGHGFKFASAVGEVLADLTDDGRTQHDIGMFRADRFR